MNHENEKESLITELSERLLNGILKENPTFVLLLGMCPTLAVTTCAVNGLGMGVTTMAVLAMSNLFISLLRKVIPDKIRIPAFIVIIASFVTIVELLLKAYIPSLYDSLGLYIPLIVVNCIILGRAEAYAYSHKPILSLFDGIGMGMGFTFALTIIGAFRELLGAGTVFSNRVMPTSYVPVNIFIMAPGAFFVLALLTAIQNKIKDIGEKNGKDMSKIQSGCGGNCIECNKECKVVPKVENEIVKDEEETEVSLKKEPIKLFKKNNKKEADTLEKEDIKEVKPIEKEVEEETIKEEPEKKVEETKTVNVVSAPVPSEEPSFKKENVSDEEDELELLDLNDVKKAISKVSTKTPTHRKASMAKAQAMFKKAEEVGKEEKDND